MCRSKCDKSDNPPQSKMCETLLEFVAKHTQAKALKGVRNNKKRKG